MTDTSKKAPFGPWSENSSGERKELVDILGGMIGISFPHHEIHEGNFYHADIDAGTIVSAATYQISITTGAKVPHITFDIWTEAPHIELALYENSNTPTGGTPVSIINANRNSSNISTNTINQGVTASGGTRLRLIPFGGGGSVPAAARGGQNASREELDLKPNTEYRILLTNEGAVDGDTHCMLSWYEIGI